jgi:hypothetical protein
LRRFSGWEPREFTEVVEWSDKGFPARSITRREVEWDDGQRLWMLALAYYEASLCRKCGHSLNDTLNPNTDPDNPYADRQWIAEVPEQCFCCKVLAKSEKKWAEDKNNRIPPEALIHTAVLVGKTPLRRKPNRRG